MKRMFVLLLFLVLLPALAGADPIKIREGKGSLGQARVADEIIVKFDRAFAEAEKGKLWAKYNLLKKKESFKKGAFTVFKHPNPQAVLKHLRGEPGVIYAEQNAYAYASAVQPDDPYYSYQWNMPRIGMEEAWVLAEGNGAVVAVIDTGVRQSLQDLAQTVFIDGYDFVNNDDDPDDDEGHGSHVCGTIAQSTDNGVGVAGIAHQAMVMPVKVLDKKGSGTYDDIADGIMWATDNGAHIINMSLGGSVDLQVLQDACEYAWNNGVLIVAAAGNGNTSAPSYPAAYEVCLSVSATTSQDTLASYSNYGSTIDLAAPGGDVGDYNGDGYDDMILQNTFSGKYEGYYFYAGTSMAAPHVAGVAALAKGINPSLTNDELRLVLEGNAEDIGVAGRDDKFGFGLVDAFAAVVAAGSSAPSNQQPLADFEFASNGLVVTFTDLSYDPDGNVVAWAWDFGDGNTSTEAEPIHSYQTPGTYAVTLTVTDNNSSSSTVVKEVSVSDGVMTMSVDDIDLSLIKRGVNLQARAQITVLDAQGHPVEGAVVSAMWSGAISASVTGVTGADGKVVLLSPRFRGGSEISIQVTDVIDDMYIYAPEENTETSDSLSW